MPVGASSKNYNGNSATGNTPDADVWSDQAVVSGGGPYVPQNNGVNLQAPQGGDYGYNAAVKGVGENYADSALGYYGAGNIPGATQNAQQAYGSFMSSTPANMNPYYDYAAKKQADDINRQMAARGSYGSSNAVGNLSAAETALRAQQAKDEASYGLQRAQLAGSLASGADASSLNASNNQLAWTRGLGDLAFQDQATGQNRFQQNFENSMGFGNVISGLEGSSYNDEFNNDRQDMNDAISAATGGAVQTHTNWSDQVNAQDAHDKQAFDTGMAIMKLGMGAAV